MPQPFPHHYEVSLAWKGGETSEISSGPRPSLPGGPPAQFDGVDETRWSPEHLVLAALAQCLMLTWISLNKRSQIPLKAWESKGESVLEKTKEGLVFTSFKLSVALKTDAGRIDEARRLLETAKKYCIIANSLKTPPTLEAVVEAA
ncbi:MAG: OsmC family protein [Elusimicrobia bacterium]|nr:OsmC family protein [Elusimicrobiota bacterium]